MYIVEDTLAMLGAVVLLTTASLFYDKSDEVPTVEAVSEVAEKAPSFYDIADKETHCLATNMYFEARGESLDGKKAVAFVTLNRVESEQFPNDICSVVYQAQYSSWWKENKNRLVPIRHKCQFSWYCDGKSDSIRNTIEYENLYRLASEVILGKHEDNTGGAEYYHADHVKPDWRLAFNKTTKIDSHIFYRKLDI
jgi:spore germination cell wall hydrolase CwlJ-like protein